MSAENGNVQENLVTNGKNKKQIVCSRCSSKVLQPEIGTYEEGASDLPVMTRLKEEDKDGRNVPVNVNRFDQKSQYKVFIENENKFSFETETVTQFFRVDDMFDFDNASFSHTVNDRKVSLVTLPLLIHRCFCFC